MLLLPWQPRDEKSDLRTCKVISKVIVKMMLTNFVLLLHINKHEICKKFAPIVSLIAVNAVCKVDAKALANSNLHKFASLANLVAKTNFANYFARLV